LVKKGVFRQFIVKLTLFLNKIVCEEILYFANILFYFRLFSEYAR